MLISQVVKLLSDAPSFFEVRMSWVVSAGERNLLDMMSLEVVWYNADKTLLLIDTVTFRRDLRFGFLPQVLSSNIVYTNTQFGCCTGRVVVYR